MAKILFIMTSSDAWTLKDGSKWAGGYWAEEAVVPFEVFKAAGHEITIATPGGVVPPVNPVSLTPEPAGGEARAARMREVIDTAPELAKPVDLADVDLSGFDAVFVPGGNGPMEDLAYDADAGRLVTQALTGGTPLGMVCHGPASVLTAPTENGSHPFAGYRITSFTNAEEQLIGPGDKAKWLLQDRLTEAGIAVIAGEPFAPHIEVDRNVVTGQNPASSGPAAEALLEQLA
ncbi:type 1 glutamine amidotransferase domain-containing protein [Streptomyces bullii]|uniref:Type 1 glutamine amidotransferase domain-containing protein n=1 Tax=Streptomyces bullii TaxID=349910 RepID=A0ABW0V169_9ACTN